jgi:DNA-binding CsgD family transcriptional regulator
MPHQGIHYKTTCTYTTLAFNSLLDRLSIMTAPERRLVIIDASQFSCFYDLHRSLQKLLRQNIFSDYLFLTDNNAQRLFSPPPYQICLNASLAHCEAAIKRRLRGRPNVLPVKMFLAREKKSRSLSGAEKHIARYLAQGFSLQDMSQLRGVTVKTIYGQVRSIRRKLGNLSQEKLLNHF